MAMKRTSRLATMPKRRWTSLAGSATVMDPSRRRRSYCETSAGGAEPVADSPEDYARFVRAEYDRWGKLVRDARIKLD